MAVTAIWILPLRSATIHVPGDYSTIQAGIDASFNGDTVLVSTGTYNENLAISGKGIFLISQSGYPETIIRSTGQSTPVISVSSNSGFPTTVEGFTVTGASFCAGITVNNGDAIILNNFITGNDGGSGSGQEGGGILAVYSNVIVRGNLIANNSAGNGGGISIQANTTALIEFNEVAHNHCAVWGAGIRIRLADNVVVSHNLVHDNTSNTGVSGIGLSEADEARIVNNTIDGNSAPTQGAITIWYSQGAGVVNNIVSRNTGIGVFSNPQNNGEAAYNDVWNNTIDYDGIAPGDGSISADPLFVGGEPFSYELTGDSPCIDAGDPNSPLDPDGSRADMGAFPFGGFPGGMGFDIADIISQPDQPAVVPVVAFGLSEVPIPGLEFHIGYDQTDLQFSGITSDYLADALVNEVDGTINIVWENYSNPVIVPDSGVILSLNFNVLAPNGSVCQIGWGPGNEVADTLGNPIGPMRYLGGQVSVLEPLSLSGRLIYYDLERPVANVTVTAFHGDSLATMTDLDGRYQFDSLFLGNYLVCPSRADDDAGVSIGDIILIERYLAQLETFDNPYKYIAADVNGNGSVGMTDVIKIRRYLAQLEPLPAGNWTFVDSLYDITPENWQQAPCCREVNLTDNDLTDVNLVGIRRGDVNNSWIADRGYFATPMKRIEDATLNLGQAFGGPGDIVTIGLTAEEIPGVAGLELHFSYPSQGLRFVGITSDILLDPTVGGGEGLAHLIWDNNLNAVDLVGGVEVAAISFEILPDAPEQMDVIVNRGELVNEQGGQIMVNYGDGQVERLTSIRNEGIVPTSFGLEQNYPNPFNASTRISFSLLESCHVNLDVFDMTGRKVATLENGHFEAGNYSVVWNGKTDSGALLSSGIYFYKLRTDSFVDTKRMLMLK